MLKQILMYVFILITPPDMSHKKRLSKILVRALKSENAFLLLNKEFNTVFKVRGFGLLPLISSFLTCAVLNRR